MVYINKPTRTDVGRNTNLTSPNPPVQSLDNTPNAVYGQGQTQMTAKPTNGNAKSKTANTSSKTKRTGGRKGGKTTKRGNNPTKGTPLPVSYNSNNNAKPSSNLTIKQSDFGYDIDGSDSPNVFVDSRDQTLFRDFNVRSGSTTTTIDGIVNTYCAATNQFKLLTINPDESFALPGYDSQMIVLLDIIRRNVTSIARATKGALDALANLKKYLIHVTIAFAVLIQIESSQAWSPSDHAYFDRSLRYLSSRMSSVEILELRTKLRQVLIPHVLPVGWMKYIKWLYSPHLRNHCPESTKLRFVQGNVATLISKVINEEDITEFTTYVDTLVDNVRKVDQTIPALMLDTVYSVEFANCNDWYGDLHNSASYDAEWNNIFNNRRVVYKSSVPTENPHHYPTASTEYYICLDSVAPYSMVLAQAARQASSSKDKPGLPLEGVQEIATLDELNYFNRFYLGEFETGEISFKPVTAMIEDNSDSIHRVEFENLSGAATIAKSYTMPAGIQSLAIYAGDSNCNMAARESLSNMTLK